MTRGSTESGPPDPPRRVASVLPAPRASFLRRPVGWAVLSFVAAAALVAGSLVLTLSGWTGWPIEPLRVAVGISAALALATQRRTLAVAMLVAWAIVACPLPVTTRDAGLRSAEPGRALATGLRDGSARRGPGPVRVRAVDEGSFAVGLVGRLWLRRADREYLDGESGDPDSDLVAFAVGWLPYPHVQRTVVQSLGGDTDQYWSDLTGEKPVSVRDDGGLIVVGHRDRLVGPGRLRDAVEVREVGLHLSSSTVTWLGWLLVALAGAGRWTARRRRA